MPYIGERVDLEELSAEVLEVERRRIAKVRLRRREGSLEPPR
jgi:CBS domain containing-hemolysin-like protein